MPTLIVSATISIKRCTLFMLGERCRYAPRLKKCAANCWPPSAISDTRLAMVVKGSLHANGQKLAAYLVTGKKGERAELVELRGFASSGIRDAFIDVHIQADEIRQCEKPFFHSYIRLPEGEGLFLEQWKHVADRIEKQLGFDGQGRAIAFHHQ